MNRNNFLKTIGATAGLSLLLPKKSKATYLPGGGGNITYIAKPTQGLTIAIGGDSISVSGNKWVDNIGGFGTANIYNYAANGARWINFGGAGTNQQCGDQVQAAITANITPDIFILNIGTNDLGSATSTVATAMGKDLATLDKTKLVEAQRWCLLKIQTTWANCKIFVCTPLQRKDSDIFTFSTMRSDTLALCGYHNAHVIDQTYYAGFNMDFEVLNGAGRLLLDGIHPNSTGAVIQANFIMNAVISQLLK